MNPYGNIIYLSLNLYFYFKALKTVCLELFHSFVDLLPWAVKISETLFLTHSATKIQYICIFCLAYKQV